MAFFYFVIKINNNFNQRLTMRIWYSDGRGFESTKHSFLEVDHEVIATKEGLSMPRKSERG